MSTSSFFSNKNFSVIPVTIFISTIVMLSYTRILYDTWTKGGSQHSDEKDMNNHTANEDDIPGNSDCSQDWEESMLNVEIYESDQTRRGIIHGVDFLQKRKDVNPIIRNTDITLDPNKFLAPVLVGGPNNQIMEFRNSLFLAIKLNRTFVIPKFFKHFTESQAKERGDSSYIYPGHRVNLKAVCKFVSCISLSQFQEACGRKVDAITHFHHYSLREIQSMEQNLGMRIFEQEKSSNETELLSGVHFTPENETDSKRVDFKIIKNRIRNDMRCLAHARSLADFQVVQKDRIGTLDENLMRSIVRHTEHPEYIKNIAQDFIQRIMKGNAFLSVHWRYNEGDWLKRCRNDIKSGDRGASRLEFCKKAIEKKAPELARFIAEKVSSIKDIKIKYVYLASPENLRETMAEVTNFLRQKKLVLFSSETVERYMKGRFLSCTVLQQHLKDILATTEMEICSRGEVFLSSSKSTWSINVGIIRLTSGADLPYAKYDEPIL